MISDKLLQVSSDQAVTVTAVSEDTIDLGLARDMGAGKPLYMLFTVKTTFTAAGASTMSLEAIVASDDALTTAIESLGMIPTVPKASLVAGKRFAVPLRPIVGEKGQRYLGSRYTVATGPQTAGTIDCDIVETIPDDAKYYASGFTV